jgi:small subunit ribosomal protein S6
VPQERLYDMVFLVTPEKDEQGAAAVVDEFRKLLVENGAVIQKDESMGRRRLAFTLKKKNEATYHNFLFTGPAACVREAERKLGLSEDVLRYLTVRVDEEMRHGQKVARKTKPRLPRRVETPAAEPAAAPEPPAAEPPRE